MSDLKPVVPRIKEERTEPFWSALNTIEDPEMMIGIVDLGLVYEVKIEKGVANVMMTLTSLGCPVGPELMGKVEDEMKKVEGVKEVKVDLVWDPPWSPEMIDADIRALLWGM